MSIHIDRKRDIRQVKEETDRQREKRTDIKNIGRQQMQDRQIEITLNISITIER